MRYRTIVADPPWAVKAGPAPGGYDGVKGWLTHDDRSSRDLAYPTMTVDEIAALPVDDLAERNAHLYLWTINAYVPDAYQIAYAWGFKPSTLLVWAKNPMGGGLGGAWGITTEYVLFCRRGTLANTGRVTGTWFNWKRPYENGAPKHSAKPPAFLDLVEQVSPGPYLEMFARSQRLGWDTWGNEALCHVEVDAA